VVQGLDSFVVKPKNYTTTAAYKLFIKADALRLANHFKESIKHYLNAILIDRKNYRTYMGLGISYKAEQKYDKAIDALEKARKLSFFTPENEVLSQALSYNILCCILYRIYYTYPAHIFP